MSEVMCVCDDVGGGMGRWNLCVCVCVHVVRGGDYEN